MEPFARKQQQIAARFDVPVVAELQGRARSANCDQSAMQVQHRAADALLCADIDFRDIVRDRQPGLGVGETRATAAVPLHRGSRAVAADAQARHVFLERVLHPFRRDRDLFHPELVAIVKRRRTPQHHQQHGGDPRLRPADAARDPRLVMIAEHPIRPAASRQQRFVFVDQARDRSGPPFGFEQREIER